MLALLRQGVRLLASLSVEGHRGETAHLWCYNIDSTNTISTCGGTILIVQTNTINACCGTTERANADISILKQYRLKPESHKSLISGARHL